MTMQEIAQQTGHNTADIEAMLMMMASRMRQDGVVDMFRDSDKDTQADFVKAYGKAAARATLKMGEQYQINTEFKNHVDSEVMARV